MMLAAADGARNRELARIHCLQRDLALDDERYRNLLWALARVRSAADLDAGGRRAVIAHFSRLARPGSRASSLPQPTTEQLDAACSRYFRRAPSVYGEAPRTLAQRPLLGKIEAQLADARRPWKYALALCRRIAKKDALELCSDGELGRIVAALAYDQERRRRRAEARNA